MKDLAVGVSDPEQPDCSERLSVEVDSPREAPSM